MIRNYHLIIILLILGCGKKREAPNLEVPITVKAVNLVSPSQNEVCTTGIISSPTESVIMFKWNAAENADSYELIYKNLATGVSTSFSTSTTFIEVKLLRNTPYSWKVISKSSKALEVKTSETWKFYSAGEGGIAYAPYPAELISPALGSTLFPNNGTINLSWKGTDVDDDISSYEVYFGMAINPPLYKSDIIAAKLEDVPVENSTIYYWKIVTKDSKGNASNSDTYQFKIN